MENSASAPSIYVRLPRVLLNSLFNGDTRNMEQNLEARSFRRARLDFLNRENDTILKPFNSEKYLNILKQYMQISFAKISLTCVDRQSP